MSIKISDKVLVYDKEWIVNNVASADLVEKELPDIGQTMKRLSMTLLVLEGDVRAVDLMIMRIHGLPRLTTVFVDNARRFYDPDAVLPKPVQTPTLDKQFWETANRSLNSLG